METRVLLIAAVSLLGCAGAPSANTSSSDYGFDSAIENRVWVRGPWSAVTPSLDVDEVIDQLCPAVMRLPRARERDYGQEYCGLIYSLGDGLYHASVASPLGELRLVGPSRRQTCIAPRRVVDARGRAVYLADFHSHPWAPSPMSTQDRKAANQRWFIRIQFDTACHIQKLIPHAGEDQPGEVYEREGKRWKLVGRIKVEDKELGRITEVASDEK